MKTTSFCLHSNRDTQIHQYFDNCCVLYAVISTDRIICYLYHIQLCITDILTNKHMEVTKQFIEHILSEAFVYYPINWL